MDSETHFKYFRMCPKRFDNLLELCRPFMKKHRTHAMPIGDRQRLAITLRLLATGTQYTGLYGCTCIEYIFVYMTGDSQQTVAMSYRIGKATVNQLFHEMLKILKLALQPIYLLPPTKHDFIQIAKDFWSYWNFPHCLGAIDGKHVVIKCPDKSGSNFFNYKKTFSVVLMAIVDAKYVFRFIDVGKSGRDNDAGIWSNWDVAQALDSGVMNLPPPKSLPGTDVMIPNVFVSDDAFPLKPYIMKPFGANNLVTYGSKVFNYRLSRSRRVVENAFGILSSRWRIFRRAIECQPQTVDSIIWACVLLHNYLTNTVLAASDDKMRYIPPYFVDYEDQDGLLTEGGWRQITAADTGLQDVRQLSSNNASQYAFSVREKLRDYFISEEGSVPWQKKVVDRGFIQQT